MIIAMVAVVASFATTMGVSQIKLRPISDHVDDILSSATPSIARLSEIEAELLLIGLRANEYADRAAPDGVVLRDVIAAARKRIDVALDSYRAPPNFPGEAERVERIVVDLALLDHAAELALRAADLGQLDEANRVLKSEFHPHLERTARDVAAARELDATYITDRSASIGEARQSARRLVTALGATSILVAILATFIVVRLLRSHARVAQAHSELLAARAVEMEAFAGRVAHDLRGPLAVIVLCMATAQDNEEALPPRMRDSVRKVSRQVQRMTAIIDGLLAFARAGARPSPGSSADLGEVLDDVLASLGPVAEAAHAKVEIAEFPPTRLACQSPALASVLSNLLGNAVKYGGHDDVPPRISIRVDADGHVAHVEIADNGAGLPPGSEQVVFEPFRQLAAGRSGIGLGLATVKKFVEAHGGRVGVRSTRGEGSTFWFEMPKAA